MLARNTRMKHKEDTHKKAPRRCNCKCGCNYRLEGYDGRVKRCGACVDNCMKTTYIGRASFYGTETSYYLLACGTNKKNVIKRSVEILKKHHKEKPFPLWFFGEMPPKITSHFVKLEEAESTDNDNDNDNADKAHDVLKEIVQVLQDHPDANVGNSKVHFVLCRAKGALKTA